MGHQQKGKGKKRPRGWHRRGYGPDNAFRNAMRRIDRVAARAAKTGSA